MNRLVWFLFCTGILTAIIAALMGKNGLLLLNGSVVWLLTVWVAATCTHNPTTKGPHK